jgi:NADH:ubiquinone reductase (non-electrogenic)
LLIAACNALLLAVCFISYQQLAEKNEDISRIDSEKLESYAFSDEEFLAELLKERSYLSVVTEKAVETLDSALAAATKLIGKAPAKPVTAQKPKIVILGSGWACHAYLKEIDCDQFDVVTVAPRNFMLYTPMLAASAVGTVEYRSITEPIRKANTRANYLEATCTAIDPAAKEITCENVVCAGTSCRIEDFKLAYDHLIVAVGATSNTFGIPGVKEHCIFMKQIDDADKLRRAIGNCFERANLPTLTDAQKEAVLTFVVVGAGPTGKQIYIYIYIPKQNIVFMM